jgi:hemerythrin-like domain-containing protein
MKKLNQPPHSTFKNVNEDRRKFMKNGLFLSSFAGIAGLSLLSGCEDEAGDDVAPPEDLMREHGVLNRILLIYDTCRIHLYNGDSFNVSVLNNSANIIRNFIEDYHEKLEENYLFPRFENANVLTDLVGILRKQHLAGRNVTARIIQLANINSLTEEENARQMIELLQSFNNMYRPHEAREDTVLFPALRKIVSRNEFYALGEDFEKKERELFGQDGFEGIVEKVAALEKQLGIYDLSQFTPQILTD